MRHVFLLVAALWILPACSDDSSTVDGTVDQVVADTGPPGPDGCMCDLFVADQPHPDAPPADGPIADSTPPPPDLPLVPPDGGSKKLLKWAQCSVDTSCQPYCGAIGSKSEGWYDGCTNQLLTNPFTSSPYWDICIKCVVFCDAIGSFSEGWYAQCP